MRNFLALLLILGVSVYALSNVPTEKALPLYSEIREVSITDKKGMSYEIVTACEANESCPYISEYRGLSIREDWISALKSELTALRASGLNRVEGMSDETFTKESSPRVTKLLTTYGEETDIEWGAFNSYFSSYYAKIGEDSFALLPESLFSVLNASSATVLSSQLISGVSINEISQLVISGATLEPIVFRRVDNDQWTVNGRGADRPFVDGYLSSLLQLSFRQILKKDIDDSYGAPYLSFSFQFVDEEGKLQSEVINSYLDNRKSLEEGIKDSKGVFLTKGELPYVFYTASSSVLTKLPREEHFIGIEQ